MTKDSMQVCRRCVMDTTDPEIVFDRDGQCHHCSGYLRRRSALPVGEERRRRLEMTVEQIRAAGRGCDFDCVIGISGGVDSSYVAYLVKRLGLRPLAVHLDNGWNSEIATENMKRVTRILGIEVVIKKGDTEEFFDLQRSFLRASIPGAEIPTDHAILATLFQTAKQAGVRYLVSGYNISTEGILPPAWSEGHGQRDWLLIRNVQSRFGRFSLASYPHFSFLDMIGYRFVRRMAMIDLLDLVEYVRSDVVQLLERELGWRSYGGKHGESVYTRFVQGFLLPVKFGIDKRKAHLSTLVVSGQMPREEALEILKMPPYADSHQLSRDRAMVLEKLGLSEGEFEALLRLPPRRFTDYPGFYNHPVFGRLYGLALKANAWLKQSGFYGSAGA